MSPDSPKNLHPETDFYEPGSATIPKILTGMQKYPGQFDTIIPYT
jgi:hypothetical protein